MAKTFTASTLAKHEFKTVPISDKWIRIIGEPETNFSAMVWGASGSGKTTFVLKLINELLPFGKVYYNSIEQGWSKSLQDNMSRSGLNDHPQNSRLVFADRHNLETMRNQLKTNRAKFVVVDSVQYLHLTMRQWEDLKNDFRKKAFILISHESGIHPKGKPAQAIRYDVDIKMRLIKGVTYCNSRYGATENYNIFNDEFVEVNQQKQAVKQLLIEYSNKN